MRFLADESCDALIVRALREAGHDLTEVGKLAPRAEDSVVIDMALADARVLLTEDKDFGQLVYAAGLPHSGVILLRYPFRVRDAICRTVIRLAGELADGIACGFIVVTPGRVRKGRMGN